jgi:stage II sporulation protein R
MLKKELKIIGISLITGFILSILIAAGMYSYSEKTQAGIAGNVIRFHVKANSDSAEDQSLKNEVRDHVMENFGERLLIAENADETRQILSESLDEITVGVQQIIFESGYDYPVNVSIGTSFFPTRIYGNAVFPPGEYEALQISIGEGFGNNWWCIMFPPLCYVDISRTADDDEIQQLMHLLPEEGYKLLTYMEQDDSIKIKFKIVEWWQNRKEPNPSQASPM